MSFGVSVGDILKLCEVASRVYKNCRDCTGEYKALTTEARNLTNLLEDIGDKYDSIPESKRQQLFDAYEACVEVLSELDKLLQHYNSLDTKSKRAWDRLKWDPERSRTLRQRLTASVVMLNSFYNSLIHDNQVLILEALGRLERDYKGGHREESMASVQRIASRAAEEEDEEDEDAAWPQIIRDLEDVGITNQDALEYRDFIVDWFVRAVNDGRLMEESTEPQSFATLSRDLGSTLPEASSTEVARMPSLETPQFPAQRSRVSQPSDSLRPTYSGPSTTDLYSEELSTPQRESSSMSYYLTSERIGSSEPISEPDQLLLDTDTEHKASPSDNVSSAKVPSIPAAQDGVQKSNGISLEDDVPPLDRSSTLPPTYSEAEASTNETLTSTARNIMEAWWKRDFVAAEKQLEIQLAAVERGEMTSVAGRPSQPDRRVLRHLIGVCASYSGNFTKAKRVFESVINGIYLTGSGLDDGDIAAARWLGDACLNLHEPHNTVLAWGVALNGLTGRYGAQRDLTQSVCEELGVLERWLHTFYQIESSFSQNLDPFDIFISSHATEKSNLVSAIAGRVKGTQAATNSSSLHLWRPMTPWGVPENMLTAPLFEMRSWPLQWDATFLPVDAVMLARKMTGSLQGLISAPLSGRELSTVGLMDAKKLHYVTKKSQEWLVNAIKTGLRELGVEHVEQVAGITCFLNEQSHSFSYAESIDIKFKKIQFRSMYGVKVTDVQYATRALPIGENSFKRREVQRNTTGFVNVIRGILEKAERGEKMDALSSNDRKTSGSSFSRSSVEKKD